MTLHLEVGKYYRCGEAPSLIYKIVDKNLDKGIIFVEVVYQTPSGKKHYNWYIDSCLNDRPLSSLEVELL